MYPMGALFVLQSNVGGCRDYDPRCHNLQHQEMLIGFVRLATTFLSDEALLALPKLGYQHHVRKLTKDVLI
jgi:hypothetical protein